MSGILIEYIAICDISFCIVLSCILIYLVFYIRHPNLLDLNVIHTYRLDILCRLDIYTLYFITFISCFTKYLKKVCNIGKLGTGKWKLGTSQFPRFHFLSFSFVQILYIYNILIFAS